MRVPDIEIQPDEPAVDRFVIQSIHHYAQGKDQIEILEAGCGRRWPYALDGLRYVLTGVDLDAESLRIRREMKNDLHHVMQGDLRTVDMPRHHFDIIYSAYVLEHVPQTRVVLANFLKWVKPGGLLILKFPDRDSVYGFVTRFTPFWFHVLYKRHMVGNPNAGKPGFGPYPTVHEEIIGRKAFHEFIREHHLTIRGEYGFCTLHGLEGLFTKFCAQVSFGRLTADYYNLLYILQVPPANEAVSPVAPSARGASSSTPSESPMDAGPAPSAAI